MTIPKLSRTCCITAELITPHTSPVPTASGPSLHPLVTVGSGNTLSLPVSSRKSQRE